MHTASEIPTVNFHLWKPCNMSCKFCFATFQDFGRETLPKGHLAREDCLAVVEALAGGGFEKINFAGGEPTLCPWLPDLLRRASELALTTSVVTNGSCITGKWLARTEGCLDWAAVSIDTLDPVKLQSLGRTTRNGPMSETDYLRVIELFKEGGVRLKINTVVTRQNCGEDLGGFIARARPERWKIFQVLPIGGQNDGQVDSLLVTREEFDRYIARNRYVESLSITVIPESNELMTGSYVMVDPAGRFFDNVAGVHRYSHPINEVGVEAALGQVSVNPDRFRSRNGRYNW